MSVQYLTLGYFCPISVGYVTLLNHG